MRENGPLLSRVVDPPGTKGGPRAGNFPGQPKNTFCPGWSHDPGQKALLSRVVERSFCPGQKGLLSRVVAPPETKGIFGRAGKIPSPRPTFSPGWIYHPRQKGPVFPHSRQILCLFLFLFTSLFKIGFHLLIRLIKLWFLKLWNKISYLYINFIHATKIINFHSSDWVNEISNFFEIIFVILTMQKYIRWTIFFKLLHFDRKWILSRYWRLKSEFYIKLTNFMILMSIVWVCEIVCVC